MCVWLLRVPTTSVTCYCTDDMYKCESESDLTHLIIFCIDLQVLNCFGGFSCQMSSAYRYHVLFCPFSISSSISTNQFFKSKHKCCLIHPKEILDLNLCTWKDRHANLCFRYRGRRNYIEVGRTRGRKVR